MSGAHLVQVVEENLDQERLEKPAGRSVGIPI